MRHARDSIPYYRERAGVLCDDLSSFPVIDARFLHDNLHSLYRLERFPDFVLQTGGTTGTPLILLRVIDEVEAVFQDRLGLAPGRFLNRESYDAFVLRLIDFNHGTVVDPPHGQPVVAAPLENPTNFKNVVRLLDEGLYIAGRQVLAGVIVGSTAKLELLTSYLEMNEIAPRQRWDVKLIVAHGSRLAVCARERLETCWGVRVSTAYGLTEFALALSLECGGCGRLLIPDPVMHEILAPSSHARSDSGEGVLVLTGLVPFMRVQPLIRYATGDLVRHAPLDCDECAGESVTLLGRAQDALIVDDGLRPSVLMTSDDVVEALTGDPAVQIDDRYQRTALRLPDCKRLPHRLRTGPPVYGMTSDLRELTCHVGVEINEGKLATRATAERLRHAICAIGDVGDRLARAGAELTVDALAPGALAQVASRSVAS